MAGPSPVRAELKLDWWYDGSDGEFTFRPDSSELFRANRQQLQRVAEFMALYATARVRISVRTDRQGSREFDLKLSAARAHAIIAERATSQRRTPTPRPSPNLQT